MKKRSIALFVLILSILCCLFGCSNDEYEQKYFSIDEIKGKTFATWPGCSYEVFINGPLESNNEIVYANLSSDLIDIVKNEKADGFVMSRSFYQYHAKDVSGISILDGNVGHVEIAALLSNTEMAKKITPELNEYFKKIAADGTLSKIQEKWLNHEGDLVVDFSGLDPNNPNINIGYALEEPPYGYKMNDKVCGIDIDIFVGFCKEYGYYPIFVDSDYDAIVPMVQTGRLDIGMSGYNIEESKKANIIYSDPYIVDDVIVGVKSPSEKVSVLDSLSKSFYRSFIENDRYLDYLKGIGVTMYITLFVVIIGTLLAFVLYILKQNGYTFIDKIVDCVDLILGRIPEIVLLLFLYYVVFAKSSFSAKTISAICLTIIFTVNVYSDINTAIMTIDKSQIEAASSLGFSKIDIFIKIIFPQVFEVFMANYEGEVISTLLESSVSGYISVVDLTRAGDIVRSTTYESFLPLIIVAIFYFVISSLIITFVGYVKKRSRFTNRSKESIMKAIENNTLFKHR